MSFKYVFIQIVQLQVIFTHFKFWVAVHNFTPRALEVVRRYRDPQLQVTGNLRDLQTLGPNIYQCFKIESIFNV